MMRGFVDLKILLGLIAISFFSCEKLKPESVKIPDYPDLEQVFNEQVQLLRKRSLNKEVWLDGKSESKLLEMDSILWKKELSFLKEINPNTPEYVGAFERSSIINKNEIHLILNSDEKGELKKFSYTLEEETYSTIKATIHEDKEVYSHHREFDLSFEKGLLKSYEINGYQKIVLKDTIAFRIKGTLE